MAVSYEYNSPWTTQVHPDMISNKISASLTKEHAPDRLIVRYNPQSVSAQSARMSVAATGNAQAGSEVIRDMSTRGVPGMQVVQVTDTTLEGAMQAYMANPDVLYVEPDYKISLSPVESNGMPVMVQSMQAAATGYPNDPGFANQWGLSNTGQAPYFGVNGADIKAIQAWTATTGSSGVTVALVDTGVDYTHPDLAANIWQNSGETVNGIDDDGNGYVDDIRGWNFVAKSNDPMDDNGHGTHCAGTMAAIGNNGIGGSGVSWNTKIMPLKFLNSQGSGYTSDAISAILYANNKGVPIISNSWSGTGYTQSLKDAIDASQAVVICAAGNSGANSDSSPLYPAAYSSSNIISVAASTYHDQLAPISNYGTSSVDIAAPGVSIYSTTRSGGYTSLNGTSMAAAFVSGAAALVKARNPSMTGSQVRSTLLDNCDILPSLSGKIATSGRLNAAKALGLSNPTPTPSPSPTPSPTPVVTRTPTPPPTPSPTPVVTRTPTPPPIDPSSPCGVYRTDVQNGFLRQGQAMVYGYYIPTDGRSRIEWSMTTSGPTGAGTGPTIGRKSDKKNVKRYPDQGPVAFDLYICKDVNPRISYCSTRYFAYGPYPSVSIPSPQAGSTYYVMVYARSGSGQYNLKMNSYKCSGSTPVIVASAGQEVSAPAAEFVNVQ